MTGARRTPRFLRRTSRSALIGFGVFWLAQSANTAALAGQQSIGSKSAAEIFLAAQEDLHAARYQAAEAGFREVLRLDPKSAAAYSNLGIVYLRTNRFQAAVKSLEQAARLAPQVPGIHLNLGLAYLRQNRFREAIPHFRQTLELEPEQDQARYLLGLSQFMSDDYPEALKTLEPLYARFSPQVDYLFILGSCYVKAGKREEGARIFGRMLEAGRDSPRIHWLLGNAYLSDTRYEAAIEEFEKARGDPRLPYLHYSLALAYYHLGNLQKALEEVRQEIAANPTFPASYGIQGSLYVDMRQLDDAIASYQKVIELDPDQGAAFYGLGKCYLLKGKVEKSVENLEHAARLMPENDNIHYQLGRAYLRAGRKAESEREFAHTQKLQAAEREQKEKQIMGQLPPSPVQTSDPSSQDQK